MGARSKRISGFPVRTLQGAARRFGSGGISRKAGAARTCRKGHRRQARHRRNSGQPGQRCQAPPINAPTTALAPAPTDKGGGPAEHGAGMMLWRRLAAGMMAATAIESPKNCEMTRDPTFIQSGPLASGTKTGETGRDQQTEHDRLSDTQPADQPGRHRRAGQRADAADADRDAHQRRRQAQRLDREDHIERAERPPNSGETTAIENSGRNSGLPAMTS